MTPEIVGVIGLIIMFLLFFVGLEIGFAMAIVGFLGFSYITSFQAGANLIAKDIFDVFSSYSLTVIPLFIFMGQLAANSGIGRKLYDSAFRFIGHIPGGLAMATVIGCTFFGAICGSTTATAATFTSVSVPEMRRFKYNDKLIGGSIASSGGLGIMIPPSVIFIVYGIFTQQSIGKLFMAGVLPGIMICILFIVSILLWCLKDPSLGPKGEVSTWKERFKSLPGAIEIIIIFIVVMGGMMKGFFTPTEGGAIGAFATLLLTIITRSITLKEVGKSIVETLLSSCMIMVIVAGATIFGHFLAVSTIPFKVAESVGKMALPHNVIMGLVLFIYLIGGCVIDALALIILTIPIFHPVVTQLGFDPIWFGVIIVLITMMGVITPPVGMNSYVVAGISKIPLGTVFRGIWPFLIALCIAAVILIFFPALATFLPSLLMGS
ncbi:MAG: Sialic acid TRAP transporter permease protein SiaT [Syntrophorhabdus sp. PtaU1.Bin058]|nr:MAG: Sialic acid TRAP transporter permease protein SiaT [Syntrophorhabdus sp. PtaU1.Bin058]